MSRRQWLFVSGWFLLSYMLLILPRLSQTLKRCPPHSWVTCSHCFSNLSLSLHPFYLYFRAWLWPGSSLTCLVLSRPVSPVLPVSSISTLPVKLAEPDRAESHAVGVLAAFYGAPAARCSACGDPQEHDSVWGHQRHSGPRGSVWLQLPRRWWAAGLHQGGGTLRSPEKDQHWLVAGEKTVNALFCLLLVEPDIFS